MQLASLGAVTVLVGGAPWEGHWRLVEEDRVAEFAPAAPWPDDPVHVALSAGLRDLAGNELADRPTGKLVPTADPG
jgi:hypothetical protein